jgi:hypothetical protein
MFGICGPKVRPPWFCFSIITTIQLGHPVYAMANKAWADSSTSFQVAIMACNAMTRWKGD